MHFTDRIEAGQKLAAALKKYKDSKAIILALPRGGVVLGKVLAEELKAPLDLLIVKKIGHPLQSEYAIGAVAEDGRALFNEAEKANIDPAWLEEEIKNVQAEARRRRREYLPGRRPPDLKNKIVIIVDDGIATGLTMDLAILEARRQQPQKIVVAIPVVPAETAARLEKEADELIALEIPEFYLGAVGAYYDSFPQVSDEEVKKILQANS